MRETCPNCGYEFRPKSIQRLGARAKWLKLTNEQKVAEIARMVAARKAKLSHERHDRNPSTSKP